MASLSDNDLLCKKCLIDDSFFVGGGSWSPNGCPKCGGTDCVLYKDLNPLKKAKAQKLFKKYWNKKYGRAKL
jgi:hypothetical protein